MTFRTKYLFLLTLFFACSTSTDKNGNDIQINRSNEILFAKLDIPKHWTEITKEDNNWVYYVPCKQIRNLQTVNITKVDNQEAICCYFGTEGQWFAIKKIQQLGDSLCFTTVLPYDTTSVDIFSMKYLDKEKNIVQWTTDGIKCIYIPSSDTIKYKRIYQICDSINEE
ncbi:MAG: hypothetical protein H0W84_11965 [Bacteroidetes bacterium]|nr:hypothetical protein [Bacteroidota bacterium]